MVVLKICEGKVTHRKRQGLKVGLWKFVLSKNHCTEVF